MLIKKITSVFCALTLLCGISYQTASAADSLQSNNTMRDISTTQLVNDMGIGINLGNTFESCGDWIAQYGDGSVKSYETAWGSPEITQKIIQGYADEGFGVLRIPVAWSNLMGSDYTISEAYMNAVKQVVDWTIDADMYAVINIHWDNGWVNKFPDNKDESMKRYNKMWSQICSGFQNYGDHLMFESQNEELGWDTMWNRWAGTSGKQEAYQLVNDINQNFVNTVRKSGGNNPKRHLLISGYNTGIDLTCDPMFKMPTDPANRCAVSVHYYTPAGFAILEQDADWGKMTSTWGSDSDFAELNKWMDMLKTTYIDKGIPVIIGEYGCPKKNKDADSVRLFLTSVCDAAYKRHICPVLWDVTGLHYDRTECKMIDQTLKTNFQNILNSNKPARSVGDIDGDGSVTITDIVMLQKSIINITQLSAEQAKYADFNKDNEIDIFDVIAMRRSLI